MERFCYRQGKVLIFLLTSLFMVLAVISDSYAHKVNIFAYVEGDLVYTESYFPDGRKVEGGTVEVYDSMGTKLLSGTTDQDGRFNFRPPGKDDLKIVLIASMGHQNSYTLSSDELAGISEGKTHDTSDKGELTGKMSDDHSIPENKPVDEAVTSSQPINLREIRKIIDQSLDQKLQPVVRELAKSRHQERISATEIFGGIGYIFGLIGMALYFSKRTS
ncbi:MAG: hypothetical protein ACMUIA_00720 [bacterium]